ncbi:E3 ubiquitin-protein ligase RNF25 isoform X1 [Pygocentrus nattereri]|uniref:E3 ubiquitin-protein ligase RNF25 n=1 Tax=Pygocentrus nattereri TaxID=42514 RepID=A0AAR2M0R5_PYGNA|nr:E3 ubiquitin-protein ligase RNF25 isoform X1 [Pygocentrus nattereri]
MAAESDTLCEIEVLQSIYLDELKVTQKDDGGWQVSVVLHPSTGEDCLSQFVCLTLTLDLDSEYPSSLPCISIHNPRGLSDDKLLSLRRSLQMEAESCLGMEVLYQLIEKAKEILTESNIPHGNCVICLYGFKEGEVFTKTSCYHYFHSHCLGRYVTHSEVELRERERELEEDKSRDRAEEEELSVVCPVCREPLSYDVSTLLSSPAPDFPQQEDEAVGAEFKRKWESLQKILERQKEKGGVIDPEAESNRFLIHINDVPADSDTTCPDAPSPEPSQFLPSAPPDCPGQTPVPQAQDVSAPTQRRARDGRRIQGEFRGGRRGRGKGGGRSEQLPHETPLPVVEKFTQMSVSSSESNHSLPKNSLLPQNNEPHSESAEQGPPLEPRADKDQTSQSGKQTGEECFATSQQDISGVKHDQQTRHSNLNVAEDAAQTIATEGRQDPGPRDRGRRHGPRAPQYGQWHDRIPRSSNQWDSAGRAYHHHQRGGRANRARGAGFGHHHRGGGPHRGTGKGMHPKTETELKKEGVL